jgi:hypothetical protein
MIAILRLASLVLVAVFLAGCPAPVTNTVLVENQSVYNVVALHVVPTGSPGWGANLLSTPLPPATADQVRGFQDGAYDIAVVVDRPFDDQTPSTAYTFFARPFAGGRTYAFFVMDDGAIAGNINKAGEWEPASAFE